MNREQLWVFCAYTVVVFGIGVVRRIVIGRRMARGRS
jgi:hypothetical protein